jgi:hypothetical protein
VERVLHTAFGDNRVRQSREFFKMDPYKAKVILELLALEDVTPRDDASLDVEGKDAIERATQTGGRYSMEKYGISVGSVLEYASDKTITCTVLDDKTVEFMGQQVSISRAAVLANASRGGTTTALRGPIWWLYEGETLDSVRQRLNDE